MVSGSRITSSGLAVRNPRAVAERPIEAVGDGDASSVRIKSFNVSGEGIYPPEHLAKRIDDSVRFEFARRDLMQHRCKQKVVVTDYQGDAYIAAAAQRRFQFNSCIYASEAAAEDKDPAGAICPACGLLRTSASVIMIFCLIQSIRPLWNRCKPADCSIA
jgi:hypothetical protein